jgi:hypothetical protein
MCNTFFKHILAIKKQMEETWNEIVDECWDFALIILLPLYIYFLLVLHKYRKTTDLSKSFFRLAFITGVCDVIYTILTFLNNRVLFVVKNEAIILFLIRNDQIIAPIIWYTLSVIQAIIHYLAICLSVHRFTATYRPLTHSQVRNRFIQQSK